MKNFISIKRIVFAACAAICLAAFANYDSLPIGYHSAGIDTYGDGMTPVLDDECYALVWISDGHEFKGFRYDSSLVDSHYNKVVDDDGMLYICPIAKDGKCPPVTFLVKSEFRRRNPNGEYRVVVLDTRTSDSTLCDIYENNLPVRVNGWGFANVSKTKTLMSSDVYGQSKPFGNVVNMKSELPEKVMFPMITDFKFDDSGNALIRFNNTMECFSYFVEYGRELKSVGEMKDVNLVEGSCDSNENFVVSIPSSILPEGGAFFKVSAKTDWVKNGIK